MTLYLNAWKPFCFILPWPDPSHNHEVCVCVFFQPEQTHTQPQSRAESVLQFTAMGTVVAGTWDDLHIFASSPSTLYQNYYICVIHRIQRGGHVPPPRLGYKRLWLHGWAHPLSSLLFLLSLSLSPPPPLIFPRESQLPCSKVSYGEAHLAMNSSSQSNRPQELEKPTVTS